MPYKAVIFDLYGTLVGNFSRRRYDNVQRQMAAVLGVPFSQFWQAVGETFDTRTLGGYRSFEANIVEVCHRLDIAVERTHVEKAVALNYEFIRKSIVPEPSVLETLDFIKRGGLDIGLITNCSAEVQHLFPESRLAEYIKVAVFSCAERLKKPTPRIYESACERLEIQPEVCIYVGDGSSEELTAAKGLGMLPILKRADLTDVYDPDRPEVENWDGIAIDEIADLRALLPELI